jgi:tetratricopeptide (TPR) repeat protein
MATRIVAMVMVISATALAGDAVASRTSATRKAFLPPSDILKRLESSPVQIRISGIEQLQDVARGRLADETWKQLVQPVEYPRVKRKGTAITLESWPRPKAVEVTMEKAELAFQHKDYGEAATWYRKTLSIAPDFYIARAYLGDTHLFGGKGPKAAIAEYDQAIAANPDDYRLYFFRANAYRQLDDLQSSLSDLRRSLVLKPRNAVLLGALQKARGAMGRAEPEVFVPRGFVRREGDAISVYADIDRPEWLAWASCKAMWMTDEAHRKDMLGTTEYGWSTIEELECLGSLMGIYESRKASGEGPTDMRLERLRDIISDGLAPAFVVYELGSRVDPQIVLRLDDKFRGMMAQYVEKYVLPPQ